MPVDVQEVNLIEEQKRLAVESAILENETFKQLQSTISEFPDLKLNMSQLVEAYMSETSGVNLNSAKDASSVDHALVNEIVRGTIYSISREENGYVLDSNGRVDTDATIRCRMLSQYRYVDNIDNLTPEQKEALIRGVGRDVGIEKEDKRFSFWERGKESISWDNKTLSSEELSFYSRLAAGNLTHELAMDHFEDMITNNEDVIQDKTFAAKIRGYIRTREELEFIKKGVEYGLATTPRQREQILDVMKNLPEAQKYSNVDEMLNKSNDWLKNHIEYERVEKHLIDYGNDLMKVKGNFQDKKLDLDKKKKILRSAVLVYLDKNAAPEYHKLAESTLTVIDPRLLKGNTNVENTKTEIDFDVLIRMANNLHSNENIKSKKTLLKVFERSEKEDALEELIKLEKPENFKGEGEFNKIQDEKKSLKKMNRLQRKMDRYERRKKLPSIKRDYNQILDSNIEQYLDSCAGENGKSLRHDEKMKIVIAAYKRLQSKKNQKNVFDYKTAEESFNLLTEHILGNPADYGNFINRNEKGEPIIDNKRIQEFDVKEFKGKGEDSKRVNDVLEIAKQVSKKKLLEQKDLSIFDETEKDFGEALATIAKKGVKSFVKQSITFLLRDEEKAKQFTDNMRENKLYLFARDTTSRAIDFTYNSGKKVLKALTMPLTVPGKFIGEKVFGIGVNKQELLPGEIEQKSQDSLKSGAIDTIAATKRGNFIYTREELELIKMGAQYNAMGSKGKRILRERIAKLPAAEEYMDSKTGKLNIDAAIYAGQKWKINYINEKRNEDFEIYRKSGKNFEQLSLNMRNQILRSAVRAFEDNESYDSTMENAANILRDIAPDLLVEANEPNNHMGLEINKERLEAIYLATKGKRVGMVLTAEQIKSEFKGTEDVLALEKLDKIEKSKKWLTLEEYESMKAQEAENVLNQVEQEERKTTMELKKEEATQNRRDYFSQAKQIEGEDKFALGQEYIDKTNQASHDAAKKVEEVAKEGKKLEQDKKKETADMTK